MDEDIKQHIAQIANFVQAQAAQPPLIEALKQALHDDSPDANLLIRRVPIICQDIRDIKNTLWWTSRIAAITGTVILTLAAAFLTTHNIIL